jgi:tetratricopeptide (TPR) repeat protein
MVSPIVDIQMLVEGNTSEIWQVSKLYLKLGRLNQSLTIAYSAAPKDATGQQLYKQHYLETVRLGAEFAEEIGDYHRAAYYWEQVTQQLPQDANAWHGLGIAKGNLQDYRGAEIALNRALQIQPGNQKVREHLTEIQQILRS